MIRAILFDTDGVINQCEQFSVQFSNIYNIPYDQILTFFVNEMGDCLIGKADLKVRLLPYLPKWGWTKGVDEFLNLWFSLENHPSKKLVDLVLRLKSQHIGCYIATNQEQHRTDFMKQVMFPDLFDGIFSSAEIGYKKPQPEFYQHILNQLTPLTSSQILFTDNEEKNVLGAQSTGIKSHLYFDYPTFIDFLTLSGVTISA